MIFSRMLIHIRKVGGSLLRVCFMWLRMIQIPPARSQTVINWLIYERHVWQHFGLPETLLFTVTGWYRTKRPMHCGHLLIFCASPICVLTIPDSSTRALWKIPAETSSSEAGRILAKSPLILPRKHFCYTPQESLACRKIFLHGADVFTFSSKEVVLLVLSLLKVHCPRQGMNLRTLGPVASTITTRPPRTTTRDLHDGVFLRSLLILVFSVCVVVFAFLSVT
jgi:hypothetical protein